MMMIILMIMMIMLMIMMIMMFRFVSPLLAWEVSVPAGTPCCGRTDCTSA